MALIGTTALTPCSFAHMSGELLKSPSVYPVLLYAEEFNSSKDVFPVQYAYRLVINKCLTKKNFKSAHLPALMITTCVAQSE